MKLFGKSPDVRQPAPHVMPFPGDWVVEHAGRRLGGVMDRASAAHLSDGMAREGLSPLRKAH
jgi:hypothetical protein